SQASAVQRAGRAGRTRAGRALRLYTRADYESRPARDRPEILRSDLAEAVLALAVAGEDPRAFPYLESPPASALDAATELLTRLGALHEGGPTELGIALAALPTHPRLGRVAIEASKRGHAEAGATIAALIAEREIRLAARTRLGARGEASHDVAASDLLLRL